MADFGMVDFIHNLFSGGDHIDLSHVDNIADALTSSGIDVESLSGSELDLLQHNMGHALGNHVDSLTNHCVNVTFGADPQYYEGMHGRVDVSYDGGWTWDTSN